MNRLRLVIWLLVATAIGPWSSGCNTTETVRVGISSESSQAIVQAVNAQLKSLRAIGVNFVIVTESPDVTVDTFRASGSRPEPWVNNNLWPGWHGVGRFKRGENRVFVDPERAPNQASLRHAIAYELLIWYGEHIAGADLTTDQPGILDAPTEAIETSAGTEHLFLRSSWLLDPTASDLASLRKLEDRQR